MPIVEGSLPVSYISNKSDVRIRSGRFHISGCILGNGVPQGGHIDFTGPWMYVYTYLI